MDIYARRRAEVLRQLGPDAVMLLSATPELIVGRDTHLRYHADAELYYLTGYTEPEAVLLLDASSDTPFTMFVRERDPERELWMGRRGGIEGAQEQFGAQRALPVAELGQHLPKLLSKAGTVYARPTLRPQIDGILQQLFAVGRATRARTGRGPHILRDPADILDEMRLVKDALEIELIREAARITAESFAETLPRVRAGAGEWDIEAHLEYGFRTRGASGPAFPTIAASGHNAAVLHYTANDMRLASGDLLLLDAGARYQMYCGDITRTVPISGRFNAEQRAIYDLVLQAHRAAVEAIVPGAPVDGIHEAAKAVLLEGLIAAGKMREDQRGDEAAFKQFFPHKTSHWLGIEVHDVGPYIRETEKLLLQEGMVLTIEPGLYLADQQIGIRIEDDILVTAMGAEILTASLPSDADGIESIVQQGV